MIMRIFICLDPFGFGTFFLYYNEKIPGCKGKRANRGRIRLFGAAKVPKNFPEKGKKKGGPGPPENQGEKPGESGNAHQPALGRFDAAHLDAG